MKEQQNPCLKSVCEKVDEVDESLLDVSHARAPTATQLPLCQPSQVSSTFRVTSPIEQSSSYPTVVVIISRTSHPQRYLSLNPDNFFTSISTHSHTTMCPQPDEPQALGANGVHQNGDGATNGDHDGYRCARRYKQEEASC